MLGRGAGRHYERDPVTCHVSPQFSMNILMAGVRVTVPPPHQLCSLLSPEPAPPITHHHQPAQAAAVTTAVATSSGLHRWQHSAVWKLPRNGVDKNIAIRLSPLTVVCSVPGTRYLDWIYLQFPVLAPRPPGVSQAIPAPGPRLGSYRILESRHGAASPWRLALVPELGGASARVA